MLHQKDYEMLHGLSVPSNINLIYKSAFPNTRFLLEKNDSIVLHSRKILTEKYKYDNLKPLKSSSLYPFYTAC